MKHYVVFVIATLMMLVILAACGRSARPNEPEENVPTYSHINLISVQAIGTLGEVGQVTASQANGNDWHAVTLSQSYTSPVIVMQPLSFNGSHPSVVRLKNVTGDSFKFQIDEWDYLDGGHTTEELSYLVLEAGQHTLESGLVLEAGTTTLDQSWKTVSFSQTFTNTPVIFTQAQTNNDPSAVTTRQRSATTSSFRGRLQEEQASDGAHAEETVGYIALSAGSGVLNSKGYEVGVTPDVVTHKKWTTIDFERSYTTPIFLAHMQTYDGSDPAALRYRNLSESGVQVFVEEEKSADSEIGHTSEVVGYAVFETGFEFGETPTGGGDAPSQLEGDPDAPAAGAIPDLNYIPQDYPQDYSGGGSFNTVSILFELDATVSDVNAVLREFDGEIVGGVTGIPGKSRGVLYVRLPTQNYDELFDIIEVIKANPSVFSVGPVVLLGPAAIPSTNDLPDNVAEWNWEVSPKGGNWGLEMSSVPQTWNLNAAVSKSDGSAGAGIIDNGFAQKHPDLKWYHNKASGEQADHGTQVGGVIGAFFNNEVGVDGINPFVNMVVDTNFNDQQKFIEMMTDPNIRVVNISAGFNFSNPANEPFFGDTNADTERGAFLRDTASNGGAAVADVMERVKDKLLVVTSGNDSNVFPNQQAKWNSPWANAALEHGAKNILIVEAVSLDKSRAGFSNIGGDISAPGVDILMTSYTTPYDTSSGTSFAAPHVTGLASYLFSLDPTLTASEVRSLIIDNAVADVTGGASPRINAFASAMAIDKLRGNDKVRKMLLDIDDGTEDGNQRVLIGAEGLSGTQDSTHDGEVDGASNHTYNNSKRLLFTDTDFIHDSGNEFGPIGDGKIDMSDFRRWRDWLLQAEGSANLDGSAEHPKKDLNLDGVVEEAAKENVYPRGDFNGDGILSRDAKAQVPGFEDEVTDLEVLESLFEDEVYETSELPNLVDSADLYLFPTECISKLGGYPTQFDRIRSYITVKGSDTVIQSNYHYQNVPYYGAPPPSNPTIWKRIYTLPVNSQGYTATIVIESRGGRPVAKAEKDFSVSPGQDILWDPHCIPQPEVTFSRESVHFSGQHGDNFGGTGVTITNHSEETYFYYLARPESGRENDTYDTNLFYYRGRYENLLTEIPPGETREIEGQYIARDYRCIYFGTGTYDESIYLLSLRKYEPEEPEATVSISVTCVLAEPPMPKWTAGEHEPVNWKELSDWIGWCGFRVTPRVHRVGFMNDTAYYAGVFYPGTANHFTSKPRLYKDYYTTFPIEPGMESSRDQYFGEATSHWIAFTKSVTNESCDRSANPHLY